jgi:hypothetical protein
VVGTVRLRRPANQLQHMSPQRIRGPAVQQLLLLLCAACAIAAAAAARQHKALSCCHHPPCSCSNFLFKLTRGPTCVWEGTQCSMAVQTQQNSTLQVMMPTSSQWKQVLHAPSEDCHWIKHCAQQHNTSIVKHAYACMSPNSMYTCNQHRYSQQFCGTHSHHPPRTRHA